MPSLDVAVVFPEASHLGGVERVTWDLLDHLAPRHPVAFVGASAPEGLPEGVEFLQVPPRRLPPSIRPLAFRSDAARMLASARPRATLSLGAVAPGGDVQWVQSVHRAWLRAAGRIQARRTSLPPHVRYLLARHVVLLAMERHYFRSSHPRAVICTSAKEVEDIVDLYGVDPSLTTVLPNPYDPRLFNAARRGETGEQARAALTNDGEGIAVVFVANELHRKGFGQLLNALALLDDERVIVNVIGRAAPTAYAPTIERLKLTDRVRYHGPTADVGWWYSGADLLVLPTQYEPFGLVIVEALASGVPVVTTRLAGASAAVQHGATGLLQEDPLDVEELAGLIARACAADLPAWGRRAAESVADYQRDVVLSRVERILFAT